MNQDVTAAIALGHFGGCAYRHYLMAGRAEGRNGNYPPGSCQMTISSASIPWQGAIQWSSLYIGDSAGVTAQWTGTDVNNYTGSAGAATGVRDIPITRAGSYTMFEESLLNLDPRSVGNYPRRLEYYRGGQLLCRTNTVTVEFRGP